MSRKTTNRRQFLQQAAATATGLAAGASFASGAGAEPAAQAPTTPPTPAGEKFVIGMMGTGGRGQWLLKEELVTRPNVEIAYLCDVDSKRLADAVKLVAAATDKAPKAVSDFRHILDDPNVHALFNVTPDHWHALPTILACQAGKDVYVEKPASHNLWEGRKMVEAARKYNRVVQLGTQTRSGPYTKEAVEFLRGGGIGDIHFVRVLNMKTRPPLPPAKDEPVPAGVDYDMWLGPAPLRPFNRNRFHYNWHWYWDYSGGDIINDGVHQIDAARFLIGRAYPKAVSCTGGKCAYDDAQETPDTQVVSWHFGDLVMTFELTLWTPHMRKTLWALRDKTQLPDWQFNGTQVQVHGTKGVMFFSRHGGGWQAFDQDCVEIAHCPGRHPHHPHVSNFFDCIVSRDKPNADIEEGHLSTVLCHLGNISYRCGQRRLEYDGKTERFPDDPDANALLKNTYREPWVVPDQV
jgi:predicted dehydrogenase